MKNLNKITLFFAISLALLFFVSAVSYGVVYTNNNNALFFNQTNLTYGLGISLWHNDTGYNFSNGDFSSLVFYNSTTSYWNISLGIADSYSSRSGVVNNFGINLSEPSLVAYWPLENTNGTYFIDSTGRNNGTCDYARNNCPINFTGLSSQAMLFDGSNDSINVSYTSYMNITKELTISAWVYFNNSYPFSQNIVTKYDSNAKGSYLLGITGSKMLQGAVSKNGTFTTGTCGFNVYYNTSNLSANTWYNVAFTANSSSEVLALYINNILVNSTTYDASFSGIYGGNVNTVIGALLSSAKPGNFFNGSIDEVLIYNRSFSQAEITTIYKAGLSQHANTNITVQTRTANSYNISDPSLVALFGLNNASGENATYFKDETGRNNGTCSSCPTLTPNGTVGNGYYFDGSGTYIRSSTVNWGIVNSWTVNMWAKSSSPTVNIFDLVNTAGANANRILMAFYLGNLEYRTFGPTGSTCKDYAGSTIINDNKWHYLSMSWDGTNLRGYVDGIEEIPTKYTDNACTMDDATTRRTTFGIDDGLTNNPKFTGSLDEVRIYNRSLSAAEIYNLYTLGSYHINWNNNGAWSSESVINDGVIQNLSSGKFMQFKTNFYTNDSKVSPYLLNQSVYSQNSAPVINSVTLNSTDNTKNDTYQNLSVSINATDINGNSLAYAYNWYKKGVLNATTLITSGLIAYYPLNNDTMDYLGSYDGTNNGATLNTSGGKMNGAYNFDGISNYIQTANNAGISGASPWTISFWAKSNYNGVPDNFNLVSLGSYGSGTVAAINSRNATLFQLNRWGSNVDFPVDDSHLDFIYVVAVYDGSHFISYSNGVQTSDTATGLSLTDNPIRIGGRSGGYDGQYFNGVIDEVMIFNRALSALEVKQLYDGSKYGGNVLDSNLTYWNENWSVGVKVADAWSGFSNEMNSSSNITIMDFTNPNATLNTPANGSYLAQTFQTFGYLFNETYNSGSFGIFNNTNYSGNSIKLSYNNLSGDYQSKVFYYNSPEYWSVILRLNNIAIGIRNLTVQTRTASSYNISDPSLVALWGLNNGTGENATYFKDEAGRYNGTCSSCPALTTNGTVGNAMQFDGSANYIPLSYLTSADIHNGTVSAWIKTTSSGTNTVFAKSKSNADGPYLFFGIDNGVSFIWSQANGETSGAITCNNGKWHNIVWTFNGTTQLVYVDGAQDTITSHNEWFDGEAGDIYEMGLLKRPSPFGYFNGLMDEVRIYNRSLSAAEVYNLYTLGSYHIADWTGWSSTTNLTDAVATNTSTNGKFMQFKTNFATDTVGNSPNLFNSSVGITYIPPTGSTQNLTATLTDESSGIKNATLYVYNQSGLYNQTDITGFAANTFSSTVGIVVNFVDGVYNWFYKLFDFAGNSYTSGNNTLIVDTTIPVVNFVSPTPDNNTVVTGNFIVNVTINDTNLANVTYNWNGSVQIFNYTNVNITNTGTGIWIFSYNQTGLLAGSFYYYNVTITDRAGNINQTESRLIKGNVAPTILNFSNIPDDNATLDPGVNIAVTANISDADFNLQSAVLKWKNSTATWDEANSTVMFNQTPIYNSTNPVSNSTIFNASIPTWTYEHSLNYMIVSNDSLGITKNSSIKNLSIFWDCTWTITTPEIGYYLGNIGGFNQDKFLGNVTITNTGDSAYSINNCSIKFARTPSGTSWYGGSSYSTGGGKYLNFSGDYYDNGGTGLTYKFNGSSVTSIVVNTSESKNLEIYANFPLLTSLSTLIERIVMPFFANITDTITGLNNVNVTSLMTVTPGAYLETAVEPSAQTVYLTPGTFNVAAYTRNVVDALDNPQNNTAFNVTLNVSLDSTLTSLYTSGDLNKSYEKVNNTNKNYTNLTFTLTADNIVSLLTNSYHLYSYTYGYENSTGSLAPIIHTNNQTIVNSTGIVTFACYPIKDDVCVDACVNLTAGLVYDPDCALPTGGTTIITTITSGGGGGITGGGAAIKSEATFELTRGEASTFELEIKNKYPGTMKKVKISVSGINSEYITINPNTIDSILGYSSRNITIKINAPAYFTGKKYTLIFDIESQLSANGQSTPLSETKYVTLYIVEVSSAQSQIYLNDTLDYIRQMNESGMNTKEISTLLDTMNQDYTAYSFTDLKTAYDSAKTIYDDAFEAKSIIEELTTNIDDATKRGIDTTETKKMLYIGESAFNRGDYSLALGRLKEAKLTFALETKGEFNLAIEIKNNPLQTTGILVGLGLVGIGSTLFVRFQLYKKKLRALKEEEMLLLELMKIVQKECFERNHMGIGEYEQAMTQYETRLSETIEDRIKIETEIDNMLKFRGKRKALDEEKQRLVINVKKAQDDYLNKGKIETRVYENIVKSYTKRLSEVEEEMATIEAETAIKRERKVRGMFKVEK